MILLHEMSIAFHMLLCTATVSYDSVFLHSLLLLISKKICPTKIQFVYAALIRLILSPQMQQHFLSSSSVRSKNLKLVNGISQ